MRRRWRGICLIVSVALYSASLTGVAPATHGPLVFVVNSTGDSSDQSTTDDACDTGSSIGSPSPVAECTLRAAIQQANAHPGSDAINFSIPGSPTGAAHRISLATTLIPVTDPVVIDASNEPDYSGTPVVEVMAPVSSADPLFEVQGGSSTIKGLSLFGTSGHKIVLSSVGNTVENSYVGLQANGSVFAAGGDGIRVNAGSNGIHDNVIVGNSHGINLQSADAALILGNRIGTNPLGTSAIPNGGAGINVIDSDNAVIGGASPGQANVISGNGTGAWPGINIGSGSNFAVIAGNFIGTDGTGTSAIGNHDGGIRVGDTQNTIGPDNVVSGNTSFGIGLFAGSNSVIGNRIGTNAAGTADRGNTGSGVYVASDANSIGGSDTDRNIISGNGGNGVELQRGQNNSISGNYIGTGADGLSQIRNDGYGVYLAAASGVSPVTADNTIADNRIWYSGLAGISLCCGTGTGNELRRNSLFSNGTLDANAPSIDLVDTSDPASGITPNDPLDSDVGPNALQNFPHSVVADASSGSLVLTATINTEPGSAVDIEFFTSGSCAKRQAATYIGTVSDTTDANGNAVVSYPYEPGTDPDVLAGSYITTTATLAGSTSELSDCALVPAPALTVDDATLSEGDSGSTFMDFTLRLSHPEDANRTVSFATAPDTAAAGADYTHDSGTVGFAAGETQAGVAVEVLGDQLLEGDETFFLNVSSTSLQVVDGQALGTIVDDDVPSGGGGGPAPEESPTDQPEPEPSPSEAPPCGSDTTQTCGSDEPDNLVVDDPGTNLDSGAGDDTIVVNAPDTTIDAGAGDDEIVVSADDVTVIGADGDDSITATGDALEIRGGAGDDAIVIEGDGALVNGGDGLDNIIVSGDDATVSGGAGADVIEIEGSAADVFAGPGNDSVSGGSGGDDISGGSGSDDVSGGGGADEISAGPGADEVSGGAGDDMVTGGPGSDTLVGGTGDDTVRGGDQSDLVIGDTQTAPGAATLQSLGISAAQVGGADLLFGGSGSDRVLGGAGSDVLRGGLGGDVLRGGDGRDVIRSGPGRDVLDGGSGIDVCLIQGDDSTTDCERTRKTRRKTR